MQKNVGSLVAWLTGIPCLLGLLLVLWGVSGPGNNLPRVINWRKIFEYAAPNVQLYGSARLYSRTLSLLESDIHYLRKHHVCKRPANIISRAEMGWTLELFIPQAFSLHLYGCKETTTSWVGTEAFFFWSLQTHRTTKWEHTGWNFNDQPSNWAYFIDQSKKIVDPISETWEMLGRQPWYPEPLSKLPPFRAYYSNPEAFENIDRPVAVVGGKHSMEWFRHPFNSFASSEILRPMLRLLVDAGFLVIYNRPLEVPAEGDIATPVLPVDDYELIEEEFSEDVIPIQKYFETWRATHGLSTVNRILLQLYAQAEIFLTTQGGNSIIGSLFGKTNIIYYKVGHEVWNRTMTNPNDMSFPTMSIYTRLGGGSGAKIIEVVSHLDLLLTLERVLQERISDWADLV